MWRSRCVVLLLCLWAFPALAEAPAYLPVQGVLTDDANAPVNDVFAVTFTLYSDADRSATLWSEEAPVNFVDGYFTAYLGSTTTLALSTFRDNSTVYLGIQVADDEEMTPFALASSPFAGYAQYAGFADDITDAAKVQIVGDVAVQLDNDGKVHDKYTDAEAIAAVTDALANDATQLEAALGATDNSNTLNHNRYTDDEARNALSGHTGDASAHHTRYTDAEVDARITSHANVADAHHAQYTDTDAVGAVANADVYLRNDGDALTGGLGVDTLSFSGSLSGPRTITYSLAVSGRGASATDDLYWLGDIAPADYNNAHMVIQVCNGSRWRSPGCAEYFVSYGRYGGSSSAPPGESYSVTLISQSPAPYIPIPIHVSYDDDTAATGTKVLKVWADHSLDASLQYFTAYYSITGIGGTVTPGDAGRTQAGTLNLNP